MDIRIPTRPRRLQFLRRSQARIINGPPKKTPDPLSLSAVMGDGSSSHHGAEVVDLTVDDLPSPERILVSDYWIGPPEEALTVVLNCMGLPGARLASDYVREERTETPPTATAPTYWIGPPEEALLSLLDKVDLPNVSDSVSYVLNSVDVPGPEDICRQMKLSSPVSPLPKPRTVGRPTQFSLIPRRKLWRLPRGTMFKLVRFEQSTLEALVKDDRGELFRFHLPRSMERPPAGTKFLYTGLKRGDSRWV